jgi:hypothetical protein
LLSFEAFDQAVQAGYRATLDAIPQLNLSSLMAANGMRAAA